MSELMGFRFGKDGDYLLTTGWYGGTEYVYRTKNLHITGIVKITTGPSCAMFWDDENHLLGVRENLSTARIKELKDYLMEDGG